MTAAGERYVVQPDPLGYAVWDDLHELTITTTARMDVAYRVARDLNVEELALAGFANGLRAFAA